MNTFAFPPARRRIYTPDIIRRTPGVVVPPSQLALRQHCRTLNRMFRHRNSITERLRVPCLGLFAIVEEKSSLLTEVRPSRMNPVPVLVRLAHHESDWIRSPFGWEPDRGATPEIQMQSLIEHLLVRYPLPRFCYRAWDIDGALIHIEREWFCHLAKGGSLRKFPGWIPHLTRRAVSHFLEAEDATSMREAIRYAQVRALSPSSSILNRVMKSRLRLDFSHDAIWLPFLEKWIHSSEAEESSLEIVIDYLWAKCHLEGVESIRLQARTTESLVRSAIRFFRELAIRFALGRRDDSELDRSLIADSRFRTRLLHLYADSWSPFEDVAPFSTTWRGWEWKMTELCNPIELAEEGADMNHCVGLYAGSCKRGETSIFSLRSRKLSGGPMDRELTIELNRTHKRLVQVKAWGNRRSHTLARQIVLRWCEENEIESSAWSLW